MQPVELRTERLLLRPFLTSDAEDVYDYARDPEFGRYVLPMPEGTYTPADAQSLVDSGLSADWDRHPIWAIEYAGRVIGSINVRVESTHRRASIGYGIGRVHWGNGLTTEAARAVVQWTFDTFDVDRVFATADARNLASRRVMEKLGMQHEGTLRQHRVQRDERVDEVYYGVLRDEWLTDR